MYTDFETSLYESAYEALLFLKVSLEENGQADVASYFEGLDPICDQRTSLTARSRLLAANRHIRGIAVRHLGTLAMNALDRALETPVFLAAG
jgi:hypothetical protein